jgi:hypothetical protein
MIYGGFHGRGALGKGLLARSGDKGRARLLWRSQTRAFGNDPMSHGYKDHKTWGEVAANMLWGGLPWVEISLQGLVYGREWMLAKARSPALIICLQEVLAIMA